MWYGYCDITSQPPQIKAYWEGGAWVEPDTTSKLLTFAPFPHHLMMHGHHCQILIIGPKTSRLAFTNRVTNLAAENARMKGFIFSARLTG